MKWRFIIVICVVIVSGCLNNDPSKDKVAALINEALNKPRCLRDRYLEKFPVSLSNSIRGNSEAQPMLEAFVAAGLLKSSGATYDLTETGRAVHSTENGGFCYAAGHKVTRVIDIYSTPYYRFWEPTVEAIWLVTVQISPKDLKPWILDTNLLKALPPLSGFKNTIEIGAKATTLRATIVKPRGKSKLQVYFTLAPETLGSISSWREFAIARLRL